MSEQGNQVTEQSNKQPRRRWRWLRRLVIVGLVAAIGVRLLLGMLLPWLTNLAIGSQFDVRWESSSLSLLDLHARLHGVELRLADQPADSPPVITISDIEANLATWKLLQGNIDIQDLRVLGLHAALDWYPDGSFELHGAAHNPTADATEDNATPAEKPKTDTSTGPAFDLQLPFILQRADLHEVHLVVHDQSKDGATREWSLDASVRNLGEDGTPA
ncbi:MAG: hypothetical protein VX747_00830, partial [Actinomycetota bacterium]|nr:hypothetical protein [Actinomycetota bacterium]